MALILLFLAKRQHFNLISRKLDLQVLGLGFKVQQWQYLFLLDTSPIHPSSFVFYRCRLSSGKVIWLCDEHAKEMKVTVLAKDAVSLQKKAASTEQPEFIAKWLREINAEKLAKKFNSAEKVKKNFKRKFSN